MWCHWGSNSVGTSRTEGRALTNCGNCVLLLSQLFPTVSVCITKLGNIREIKWTDSSFHKQKINEKESHEVLNIFFFFFSLFFSFFLLSSPLSSWLVLSKWSGSMFIVRQALFSAPKWESHLCPMPRNNCDNTVWIEEEAGLSRLAGKAYLNCTYSTVRQFNPLSTLLCYTWLL